jgi:hypothetical protein
MEFKDTNQSQIMQKHIAACKTSGLKITDYCSQHEIKVHQYYYWQKKLQLAEQDGNFIKMAPVLLSAGMSIVLANGTQISFTTLPPVDYVKQLTR